VCTAAQTGLVHQGQTPPQSPVPLLLERRDALLGRVVHVSVGHRDQEARCRADQLGVLRQPRDFSEQSVQDDALTEPEGPQQRGDRRAVTDQSACAFQLGGRRIYLARVDAVFQAGQHADDMLGDVLGRHADEIRVAPQLGNLTPQAPHHVGRSPRPPSARGRRRHGAQGWRPMYSTLSTVRRTGGP
jgi:hypothetical protein